MWHWNYVVRTECAENDPYCKYSDTDTFPCWQEAFGVAISRADKNRKPSFPQVPVHKIKITVRGVRVQVSTSD